MINSTYANALKEVSDILENTDEELINKIPTNFMEFVHENMNSEYKSNINFNIDIDKQTLLYETSAILSLIYRSYWATDEEKKYLAEKDLIKQTNYDNFENTKPTEKIENSTSTLSPTKASHTTEKAVNHTSMHQKAEASHTIESTNLIPIHKDNIIIRFFKKIINIFKK